MRSSRSQSSLVASPVFVGALTVLIVVIAVFLAYGANSGLPFVPTYQIKVVTTDAAELVRGNDVRIGGARVGLVKSLTAHVAPDGSPTAVLGLALDKTVQPLPVDSQFVVRQRSNLGLKYLELIPGSSKQGLSPGGSLDTTHGKPVVDLNDLLDTFDSRTRNSVRGAIKGAGDAFAGRGSALNDTIGALKPLFTHLLPVSQNLSDPATGLGATIRAVAAGSSALVPAAPQLSDLFTQAATTFKAIASESAALGRGFDLAAVFPELRRHEVEPERAVKFRFVADLRNLLRGPFFVFGRSFFRGGETVFVQRPAALQRAVAEDDVVFLAPGEIAERKGIFRAAHDPQIGLDA